VLAGRAAPAALAVDLNTAERPHLLALGLDGRTAARALASRRKDGDFASLEDFAARAKLLPAQARRLAAQQEALVKPGPYRRD
jgi:DNA uptake protein ComE-like DNA-binding protein